MDTSLTKLDFAQVLAGVLTRHNDPVVEASDSSSDCEVDKKDDDYDDDSHDHDYQNCSRENEYANRETIVKLRMKVQADKQLDKSASLNKPPRAVPRLSRYPKPGPSLANKPKNLNRVEEKLVESDYDDICADSISVQVDLKASEPPQSPTPGDKTQADGPTTPFPELIRNQNSDRNSRPLNRGQKVQPLIVIQDKKKPPKIRPPPPTPQQKKSPDLSSSGKSPLLTVNNNNNYGEVEGQKVLKRLRNRSSGYDDAGEWPEGNKKEMKGFMECSRLDRSTKVAENKESWTRYFVFFTEGILSFFEKETDVQNGNDLPVETTFLKDAAILINKPVMKIITIHCCNGISYRLRHKDQNLVTCWFDFLKEAEISLKEKQKALPKNSPCLSPAVKQDTLIGTAGPYLSNAFQANKTKLIQFIKKRVTKNELKMLGIYKEPIFGGTLEAACSLDGSTGPPTFIKLLIEQITERGLHEDGIYRKSGSVSAIQNVRLQINEGVYRFEEVNDVHTLTGVVKLYFRELSNPLIPCSICNSFVPIIGLNSSKKVEVLTSLLIELPSIHRHSLNYLLKHLRKVYENEPSNRMSMKNLSLIFGPTLAWSEEGAGNIPRMMTLQALLVENLLEFQSSLF